jgi:hypothetical protein
MVAAATMLMDRRRRFWRIVGGWSLDLAIALVGAVLIAALVLAIHG